MLPKVHRVRSAKDYSNTVRSGARTGRRNVVLYARFRDSVPSRFGFIVSKAVGNAVRRNLVKRRLRAVSASLLEEFPNGYDVVMRALPVAASASWDELNAEVHSLMRSATRAAHQKHRRRDPAEMDGDGD
ncbi:ribonuclease P protein component [Zhihengliuella salsuginis]|uniref:Ribonuclease P protein component n=1 Tax=Zhihengliuella salsuginis TaxID=578222 RepID=A0ABQ3GLD5_9MICC|nr:ribonuclease P protein component [Zhihengliuella salsuginis]GHD11350.1 ribonuclease P protein component [Zhihengliuella salsuginis]